YIKNRKAKDKVFAKNYDIGYTDFKIGLLLKKLRIEQGVSQEELARKMRTKKSVISRMENHAEDIRLSTLTRAVNVFGKRLQIVVS
ncbi:MAG: helix-turn-helix transcriptional regulator, partial [Candidatus Margulisbacteria bacterium]|nr:helix-turn-helix transcriptional regulator [Candidatus Margulisiibacteriota bacterium]